MTWPMISITSKLGTGPSSWNLGIESWTDF